MFAPVADPAAQKELAAADAPAAPAWTACEPGCRASAQHAGGAIRARRAAVSGDAQDAPSGSMCRSRGCWRSVAADLERNTAALKAACAQYLPHGHAAGVRCTGCAADKPRAGAVARRRASSSTQLRDFVVAHQIVSIPSDEQALVAEAPPYNRSNAAFINVPGPYENGVASDLQHRAAGSEVEQPASAPTTSRARRPCCSPPCTRCGRDISCSSCIRTATPRSSTPCGSAMRTRKAGRTTARR